jgi:hypothetical protein
MCVRLTRSDMAHSTPVGGPRFAASRTLLLAVAALTADFANE